MEKNLVRTFGIGGITRIDKQMIKLKQKIEGIQSYTVRAPLFL
jgi:hypothetical protein